MSDFCRGLNRFVDGFAASLVLAVGEDDHRLASDLGLQLLVGGEIDGVVQQRSAGTRRTEWDRRPSPGIPAAALPPELIRVFSMPVRRSRADW